MVRLPVALSRAAKRDDRQMETIVLKRNFNRHDVARRSGNQRLRLRTLRPSWPTLTRLDAGPAIGWLAAEVDFIRRATGECLVRSMLIEPIDVAMEFSLEIMASHGDRHLPGEFRFKGAEESLDNRNASVLAHRAVAHTNFFPLGPIPKGVAIEDAVAIGDEVIGLAFEE